MKRKKGFTLIELLVVIGIVVILLAAAIVAINPFRQFALANNANRWSGITTIMNAIYQNVVDPTNAGTFNCTAGSLPTTSALYMATGTGNYDICGCLVPTYLGTMPIDPQNGVYTSCSDYNTNFNIIQSEATGRITICASTTQLGETICTTR